MGVSCFQKDLQTNQRFEGLDLSMSAAGSRLGKSIVKKRQCTHGNLPENFGTTRATQRATLQKFHAIECARSVVPKEKTYGKSVVFRIAVLGISGTARKAKYEGAQVQTAIPRSGIFTCSLLCWMHHNAQVQLTGPRMGVPVDN